MNVKLLKIIENIAENGNIAHFEQFLYMPQYSTSAAVLTLSNMQTFSDNF